MNTNRINISPLDSRYANKIHSLRETFSEENLIRTRIQLEKLWLLYLVRHTVSPLSDFGGRLLPLSKDDELNDCIQELIMLNKDDKRIIIDQIEEIEKKTNHDIAALVKYLQHQLQMFGVSADITEFVHFGLTSQDIMTTGYNMVVKEHINTRFSVSMGMLKEHLQKDRFNIVFLGRTHGQPAIPTSFKKEFDSFVGRINIHLDNIINHISDMSTKFGGAINNFAAAKFANKDIDWDLVLDSFIEEVLQMNRSSYGTQTDNYESLCNIFDSVAAVANILVDFCRDAWTYCMLDYFRLEYPKEHVGSSTMAQKVNPIDFENAEGNLEIASMWFRFLSDRLRKSRLQRDLSDSTIMRNIGIPFGHFDLAVQSIIRGINKVYINEEHVVDELENNYQVLAEAVQTKLKYVGVLNAFDEVKHLFKGKHLDKDDYKNVIDELIGVDDDVISELRELTPQKYFY